MRGQPTLQRRHFEHFAQELKYRKRDMELLQFASLCQLVADMLRPTNPQFNRERFLKACGLED